MRCVCLFLMVVALLQFSLASEGEVRVIYFVPSDGTAQSGINSKIDRVIKGAKTFYSNKVGKTFTFEANGDGTVKVHRVDGGNTDAYYEEESKWRVWDEIEEAGHDPTANIYVAFVELESGDIDGWCGTGGDWDAGGVVTMATSSGCLDGDKGIYITVHELGHAFGLRHDTNWANADFSTGEDSMVTSDCAIEWLKANAHFNGSTAAYSTSTTVEIESPVVSGSEVSVTFTINDSNGLHQAQFFHHITATGGYEDLILLDCESLDGSSATVTFTTTTLTSDDDFIAIRVINDSGNQFEQGYTVDLSQLSSSSTADSTDGGDTGNSVNTTPLSLQGIADNFGQLGANPADVNGDGVVNIQDLVLAAGALGNAAAAPSASSRDLGTTPTRAEVQEWLREAREVNLKDPEFQRGILALEQLLVVLTPQEAALLPNYPNPFNPETWIPYQLSEAAEVAISIYDVTGNVVRSLNLGHQGPGFYHSRSEAAYWDGKNNLNEGVASGIYFYHIQAGEFSATRRMLILK